MIRVRLLEKMEFAEEINVAKCQEAIPNESQKLDTDGEQTVAVAIRPPKDHGLETVKFDEILLALWKT